MQPKRLQVKTYGAMSRLRHLAPPAAAPGMSPVADLQFLIQARYYADATIAPEIPLPARLAVMLSLSAILWAGIGIAVRLAVS